MRALASQRTRLKASLLSSGPSHGSQRKCGIQGGVCSQHQHSGSKWRTKQQVNGDMLVKSHSPLLLAAAVCVGDQTELGDWPGPARLRGGHWMRGAPWKLGAGGPAVPVCPLLPLFLPHSSLRDGHQSASPVEAWRPGEGVTSIHTVSCTDTTSENPV